MPRLFRGTLPTALAAVVLSLCGAIPASANHVACGDVLRADTVLDSDLTGCPADGLVIGTDGITLDLAGHTISGEGRVGVDNDAGHRRVTIKNGIVEGFGNAVRLVGATENYIGGLRA